MADWLIKLYDGDGDFVGSEWVQAQRAPLSKAGKLVRSVPRAVRYEVLEDGRQQAAGQYDIFSTLNSEGEGNGNHANIA